MKRKSFSDLSSGIAEKTSATITPRDGDPTSDKLFPSSLVETKLHTSHPKTGNSIYLRINEKTDGLSSGYLTLNKVPGHISLSTQKDIMTTQMMTESTLSTRKGNDIGFASSQPEGKTADVSVSLRSKWRYLTQEEKDELMDYEDNTEDEEDLDEDDKIPWKQLDLSKTIHIEGKVSVQEFARILHEAFPRKSRQTHA
jgi:hypothetical protein